MRGKKVIKEIRASKEDKHWDKGGLRLVPQKATEWLFPGSEYMLDAQTKTNNKKRWLVQPSLSLPHFCFLARVMPLTEAYSCWKCWFCGVPGTGERGAGARTIILKWEQSVWGTNILVDRTPNNLTSHCLALLVLEPFTSIPVHLWPYPTTYHQEHFYLLKKIVWHSTLYALFFQFMPSVCQSFNLFRNYKPLYTFSLFIWQNVVFISSPRKTSWPIT